MEIRNAYEILVETQKERDHFKDFGEARKIMLIMSVKHVSLECLSQVTECCQHGSGHPVCK